MMVELLMRDYGTKETTCRNCGSLLSYMPSEEKERRYSAMGEMGTITEITCPACGVDTIIKQT